MAPKSLDTESRRNLTEWAQVQRDKRFARSKYLQNPPEFSDLWVKRELLQKALKGIADESKDKPADPMESKGANMEVYDFIPGNLEALLTGWAEMRGHEMDEAMNVRIHEFATYISKRFVFKVGNVKDFIVRFGKKAKNYPRDDMHDVFAPLGFPIKHQIYRVRKLAREVLRFNKYLGNEEKTPITGPYLKQEIERFLSDPAEYSPASTADEFIAFDDGNPGETMEELAEGADTRGQYIQQNEALREPQLEDYEDKMRQLFDAVAIMGVHDLFRRLSGYDRHTSLGYEQVAEIIREQCEKYKDTSFLVPEHTTFGFDPRMTAEKWAELEKGNEEAVKIFQKHLEEVLPSHLEALFESEEVIHEFCHQVLEHHHEIPEYKISPASSVLSYTFVKFLGQAVYHLSALALKRPPGLSRRTDFHKNEALAEFFRELSPGKVRQLRKAIMTALKGYKKEAKNPFQRYEKTQVKTQDRLDYDEKDEVIKGPISIRVLINEQQDLLKEYPEIAEKLVVFFYQVYKMFQDTGYIPDLRPENIKKYAFMMGEWAIQTENIQIMVLKNADGGEVVKILNIDPEDHFRKLPKREEDRNPSESIATSGFSLAGVCFRSIPKALGRFSEAVARKDDFAGIKTMMTNTQWVKRWCSNLLKDAKNTAIAGTKAFFKSLVQGGKNWWRSGVKKWRNRKKND